MRSNRTETKQEVNAPVVKPEAQPLQIMVLGAEMKRIVAPKPILTANYHLHFEPFDTPKKFTEFDGVIVFQGTFEMEETYRQLGGTYLRIKTAKNQLDSRIKELRLLLEKGGFACFVLCEPFIDTDSAGDTSETDLVKYFLKRSGIYRRNFDSRVPHVRTVLSEFKPFLDVFGAANTWFNIDSRYDIKRIALSGNRLVGMIFGRQILCVPTQIPETPEGVHTPRAKEYFSSLGNALAAVVRKLAVEVPAWADDYKFTKERAALAQQETLTQELARINAEIDGYRTFKWILIYDGDDLVDAVRHVLETGFGFKVDPSDEYREDMKLLDAAGQPFLFAEVKGTNGGVKREHVNQADSHRERAGLPPTFPSVLIMNTGIKSAGSLAEKDGAVASEQVEHAKRHNILVLRTLDLLRLLGLHDRGAITKDDVQRLLATGAGWLKVTDERAELVES